MNPASFPVKAKNIPIKKQPITLTKKVPKGKEIGIILIKRSCVKKRAMLPKPPPNAINNNLVIYLNLFVPSKICNLAKNDVKVEKK